MVLQTEKEILRKLAIFKILWVMGCSIPPNVWFKPCLNSWLVLGVLMFYRRI